MLHFQGYLRSYANEGSRLEIRLFAGMIDPEPEDHPVTVVAIHEPQSVNEAIDALKQLEREDAWLYLTQPDKTILDIESENGTEYQLQGKLIEVQAHPYGPAEWEWLARSSQQAESSNRTGSRATSKNRRQGSRSCTGYNRENSL
jgi:hypothetical protein